MLSEREREVAYEAWRKARNDKWCQEDSMLAAVEAVLDEREGALPDHIEHNLNKVAQRTPAPATNLDDPETWRGISDEQPATASDVVKEMLKAFIDASYKLAGVVIQLPANTATRGMTAAFEVARAHCEQPIAASVVEEMCRAVEECDRVCITGPAMTAAYEVAVQGRYTLEQIEAAFRKELPFDFFMPFDTLFGRVRKRLQPAPKERVTVVVGLYDGNYLRGSFIAGEEGQ